VRGPKRVFKPGKTPVLEGDERRKLLGSTPTTTLRDLRDWLPRHAEGSAQLLLADALAGDERAVGDRFDQLLIGTVDQCRLGVEMLHPGTAAFEFGILT
jgi:hypothetical protein